ncbi:MAG: hypothetical protein QOE02_4879 [Rhodospirillaceae bacterium]|nr:hypothetical protein [Rhodospirillaceae bacterium]
MADEAHLAVLKQGADTWNAWRAAHAGTPADLANASLRGLDLAKANLAGADCRKADLRGTILSGATLTDANLAGANFFKSVLDAADLAGANLVGAQSSIARSSRPRGTGNQPSAIQTLPVALLFPGSPTHHEWHERHAIPPGAEATATLLR